MLENWTNVVAALVGLAISYLVVTFAFQPKVIRFTVTPPAGKLVHQPLARPFIFLPLSVTLSPMSSRKQPSMEGRKDFGQTNHPR
jgi:hypothetical protein